jgi:hypothetical protein
MPKIKLELNEPLEASLKYAKGRHYDSTIPTKAGSMMYSLASGDVIFLDEDLCDEPDELFAAAHIAPGVPFRLTLRKRNGQRYYELVNLAQAAPAKPEPPTALESTLRASIDHVQAQRATAREASPAAPVQATRESAQPSNNSAAHMMAAALISAIDAAMLAEQYAKTKGIAVQFTAEDFRAIAATLYIQASKDPRFAAAAEAKPNGYAYRQ